MEKCAGVGGNESLQTYGVSSCPEITRECWDNRRAGGRGQGAGVSSGLVHIVAGCTETYIRIGQVIGGHPARYVTRDVMMGLLGGAGIGRAVPWLTSVYKYASTALASSTISFLLWLLGL